MLFVSPPCGSRGSRKPGTVGRLSSQVGRAGEAFAQQPGFMSYIPPACDTVLSVTGALQRQARGCVGCRFACGMHCREDLLASGPSVVHGAHVVMTDTRRS